MKETYQAVLSRGILQIEEFHINVDTITPSIRGYELGAGSQMVEAKKVVMCLGALHSTLFPDLAMRHGFIDHHSQFIEIPSGPVLIAGSGLTAVDAARSLLENHNYEIHSFSRHGYAPTCLTHKNIYVPRVLNWKNLLENKDGKIRLSHFLNLLHQECKYFPSGGEFDPALNILKSQGLAQYFAYLMTRAAAANLPYQDTLVSTRPYMHKLWQLLSVEDRMLFAANYGSAWAAWRHAIPYEVISELAKAARDDRLFIHKANKAPLFDNGTFSIEIDTGHIIKSPLIVDGTGCSNRLETINSPLLRNLLQQGLIEAHPCGGMDINPTTFECKVHGKRVPNLYNIGPLNKGCLFMTNAFWFNAYCAGQWSWQYVARIPHKNLEIDQKPCRF